jgi:hypothetical protein
MIIPRTMRTLLKVATVTLAETAETTLQVAELYLLEVAYVIPPFLNLAFFGKCPQV